MSKFKVQIAQIQKNDAVKKSILIGQHFYVTLDQIRNSNAKSVEELEPNGLYDFEINTKDKKQIFMCQVDLDSIIQDSDAETQSSHYTRSSRSSTIKNNSNSSKQHNSLPTTSAASRANELKNSTLNDRSSSKKMKTSHQSDSTINNKASKTSTENKHHENERSNPLEDLMLLSKKDFIEKFSTKIQTIFDDENFEKKMFIFEEKEKLYCSLYNFFYCKTDFGSEKKPKNSIDHRCFFCADQLKCTIGKPGNLKSHLITHTNKHKKLGTWLKAYDEHMNAEDDCQDKLSSDMYSLLQYFNTSTVAQKELTNPYLRNILKIKLPCEMTFRNKTLPNALKLVKERLDEILSLKAEYIAVSTDIWTDKAMKDYIAITASAFIDGVKQNFVISIMRMPGRHNSENIGEALEQMINEFNFDKNKIIAFVTDEGSSLVRLIKQTEELRELINEWLVREELAEMENEVASLKLSNTNNNEANQIEETYDTFKSSDLEILQQINDQLQYENVINVSTEKTNKVLIKMINAEADDDVLSHDEIKSEDEYNQNDQAAILRVYSAFIFWKNHRHLMPNLRDLALKLLTIPSTSAFVERFFSICGVVNDKRRTNMREDTFVARTLLKSNVKILNELRSKSPSFDDIDDNN